MENKTFEVKIYYSGFCTYQVEAENQDAAIIKARNLPIDKNEILNNLENWKEADTAIQKQMNLENEIISAIKLKQKLKIEYDNEDNNRIIFPHILFIDSTNDKLIDAYQNDGFSKHPERIPGWRTFNILKITQLKTLNETFNIADGYNPSNIDKYKIIIGKI